MLWLESIERGPGRPRRHHHAWRWGKSVTDGTLLDARCP